MWILRSALIVAMVLFPAGSFNADIFAVTKTADTNGGNCDPDCSLREAIEAANANPGADDVSVPAGTYLLMLGQFVVSDDVSIAGVSRQPRLDRLARLLASKTQSARSPHDSGRFILVAGEGFEPPTSGL